MSSCGSVQACFTWPFSSTSSTRVPPVPTSKPSQNAMKPNCSAGGPSTLVRFFPLQLTTNLAELFLIVRGWLVLKRRGIDQRLLDRFKFRDPVVDEKVGSSLWTLWETANSSSCMGKKRTSCLLCWFGQVPR